MRFIMWWWFVKLGDKFVWFYIKLCSKGDKSRKDLPILCCQYFTQMLGHQGIYVFYALDFYTFKYNRRHFNFIRKSKTVKQKLMVTNVITILYTNMCNKHNFQSLTLKKTQRILSTLTKRPKCYLETIIFTSLMCK